jgi:hypothetical protein
VEHFFLLFFNLCTSFHNFKNICHFQVHNIYSKEFNKTGPNKPIAVALATESDRFGTISLETIGLSEINERHCTTPADYTHIIYYGLVV